MATAAMKLARALGVSVEWMIDDSQSFPSPPATALAALGNEELRRELGRRMLSTAIAARRKIEAASAEKWRGILEELVNADVSKQLTKTVREAIELPRQIDLLVGELTQFDPHAPVGNAGRELGLEPDFELTLIQLVLRMKNLESMPGYLAAAKLGSIWLIPDAQKAPWFEDAVKHARAVAMAELARPIIEPPARAKKSKA